MMKSKLSYLVVGVLCCAVVFVGCKRGLSEEERARLGEEVNAKLTEAQNLQMQGQFTEALRLLDSCMSKKKYADFRATFFAQKVDFLLAQNKSQDAEQIVLDMWKSNASLAQSVFGRIDTFYKNKKEYVAEMAWAKRLIALDKVLPADCMAQALEWLLTASVQAEHEAGIQESVRSVLKLLPDVQSTTLLRTVLNDAVENSKFDVATTIIRLLADEKISEGCTHMVLGMKLRIVLGSGAWSQLTVAFVNCVGGLPDDELLQTIKQTFSTLQKKNKAELVESLALMVVQRAPAKEKSVSQAARVWVDRGMAANKKILPERLETLVHAKVNPEQIGMLFSQYFYETIDDAAVVRKLCGIGEKILPECKDKTINEVVKVRLLDGAFIVENYDLAVDMLEKGIPGKDQQWHDMSIPKVKAHRALAKNQPREAIAFFRQFMEACLKSSQTEEFDPTTGVAYSREWILARNEKRIAGIYDSIKDADAAKKSNEEAKRLFKLALEKAAKDPDALKLLKEETKDMGL